MIKVGLTGGIGSGKSTVAKLFEVLRVPVYYADEAAKRLMVSDPTVRQHLIEAFGPEVYDATGQLQRSYLSEKVFNDQTALDQLNNIVHPAVGRDGERWLQAHQHYPYVVKEAALLFEAGTYAALDTMVCVVAPESLRLQRVMQRDDVPASAVRARMDKQWPQAQKAERSDHIITNDGVIPLIPQVLALHQQFSQAANAT